MSGPEVPSEFVHFPKGPSEWSCQHLVEPQAGQLSEKESRVEIKDLLQAVRQPRNCLQQIVVDDHHGKQHQENEGGLIDAFLDAQADVAPHESSDEEEEPHITIGIRTTAAPVHAHVATKRARALNP